MEITDDVTINRNGPFSTTTQTRVTHASRRAVKDSLCSLFTLYLHEKFSCRREAEYVAKSLKFTQGHSKMTPLRRACASS